jgi:hypothetical protein
MPLSYGSIAGNLSSCIQHPSAVLPTTAWFAHARSRSFSGGALAAPAPRQQVIDALGGMIRQAVAVIVIGTNRVGSKPSFSTKLG